MNENQENDVMWMNQALTQALAAKGNTFPNPAVGAIIVKNNMFVASGATDVCGGPHAEKVAIKNAGNNSRGATLYVTLEPCCHFGRTPPCTDAIIDAGIKRVVVAVADPNPLVRSKGIKQLRDAHIEVQCGVLEKEAAILNEEFFFSIVHKRAWITLKLAMTLDGRIADCSGGSKWITCTKSREFVHELRRQHAAIAVGRNTLELDDPHLTVRHRPCWDPVRIVFSSSEVIPSQSFFSANASKVRSIVVVRGGEMGISKKGDLEIWYTGTTDPALTIDMFRSMAYEQGLTSIFVEGGRRVASQLLENRSVNRLYLFYGNKILGGGLDGIAFGNGLAMQSALSLKEPRAEVFESDVMITGLL